MIQKILYTCQICNTDYADKEKAIACEKSHKTLEGAEFVGEYKRTPTSLYKITNQTQDMRLLKDIIFNQIYSDFMKVKEGYDFYNDIKEYDYLKDRQVYADINNEVKQIKVIGIDKDYSLKVLNDNETYNLSSGEITFHL